MAPGSNPSIIVIMGPPGAGKTTLGGALAKRLGVPFTDGDDLHPAANITKMTAGIPLNDQDRAPWLAAIGEVMDRWISEGSGGVVACSALKRRYRLTLREGRPQARLVYIEGQEATLRTRVAERSGHFMPPHLLTDQLAVLEPPGKDEAPIVVPAEAPTAVQVEAVRIALNSRSNGA